MQKTNKKLDDCVIEHMIISAKKIKGYYNCLSSYKIIQGYADKHMKLPLCIQKKISEWYKRNHFYTAKKFKAQKNDIVVNLQADEFNINMAPIKKLLDKVKNSKSKPIATLDIPVLLIKLSILIKIM